MPTGCIKNFRHNVRGTGQVTPTIFGIRSNISSKLLELRTSNFLHSFVFGKTSRRGKKFSLKWRVVGHVTIKILFWHTIDLIKFANKTANIKYRKHISLQHRVRATKSHIQNSTNHFFLG